MVALPSSLSIAVIGAGAGGLTAARSFLKRGVKNLTIFESSSHIGGVWKYSQDPTRPMYRNLQTNLPKEIMGFREYPFVNVSGADSNDDSYVTHEQVFDYLVDYTDHFGLTKYIRFNSPVKKICYDSSDDSSDDSSRKFKIFVSSCSEPETFDAVVVANGHYSKPNFPTMKNLDLFTGRTMHSVEYDDPDIFSDESKCILCIGGKASGTDIAKEISRVIPSNSKVFLSMGGGDKSNSTEAPNIVTLPKTVGISDDGKEFVFERGNGSDDGNKLAVSDVSTVIFCTGFLMDFPFLDSSDFGEIVFKERRRMSPLYKQLFYARDPRISFVGIPHSVVPFPFMEGQSECIAETIFSDLLPDLEGRIKSAKVDFESGGSRGGRVEDTHYLGSAQFDYLRGIAVLSSTHSDKNEKFLLAQEAIYEDAHQSRMSCVVGNDSYRKDRYLRDHETHLWKKC